MLEFFSNLWKGDTPRKHVLGFYETMKPFHEANCKQWYLNLSMLRGNQWASYPENSNILSVPSAPTWRLHLTYNKLLPLAVMQRHKLMPDNPTINVRPANTGSDIDKKNSETARALLRAKWKEEDFQEELEEMTWWMVPCTMGYMLTLWDGRAGTEISAGVGTGEQMFDSPSPFEIIPDYSDSRFKRMRRFLRIKVRSLEYIKYRYKKEVKAQKLDTNSIFQLKAQALSAGAQVDITKAFENHAVVFDMWEMPSVKYPKGFHHICTEDADMTAPEGEKDVIEPETLDPYYALSNGIKNYFLPLDAAQMIQLPGMLVGTNCVEQATPAQCSYNKGTSTIQENANRLGRTKVLAPVGKIPKGAMIENPAEIITEYDETIEGEIIIVKPPEMAQFHLNHIYKQPAEMQDSFGIHDATQGVLPRRATSGKAIGFLVGQDDERHLDPKADVDKVIGHAFAKALNLMANGYTEERIKDLIGDDGKILSRKLKGEELRVIDVTITRDIALPKSAADRMDLAMAILDKKATKEQMEIVFAIMQAQNIEDLKAILRGSSEAEEIYARMENFDMAKLIERPVSLGENHLMHIKIHEEMIKNPNTSQDAKMLDMSHIQAHQQQAGMEAANAMPPAAEQGAMVEAAPEQTAGVSAAAPAAGGVVAYK